MKIVYLSSFFPYSGNIVSGNTMLCRAMAHSNEVIAMNYSLLYPELFFSGKEAELIKDKGYDIYPNQRLLNTANPASYYSTTQAIDDIEPQLFITRIWHPYLAISLGSVAKYLNKSIKKIALVDSLVSEEKTPFQDKGLHIFANVFDEYITFAPKAEETLLSLNSNAKHIAHPLPMFSANAEQVDKRIARKVLGIADDKKIMLMFGNVRKYKGIDIAMSALERLDDSYHLIIAGNSPSGYDYYCKKIKDLKIENKVTLIEREVNRNEIPYIFQSSDVLLMPFEEVPYNEYFSDAFSFQLPVIASDVGIFKQIFKENELGIVLENRDTNTLVASIQKYYVEKLEEKFSKNLFNLRYNYSWEGFATFIFDRYNNLLDKKELTIYS